LAASDRLELARGLAGSSSRFQNLLQQMSTNVLFRSGKLAWTPIPRLSALRANRYIAIVQLRLRFAVSAFCHSHALRLVLYIRE
jgi:hypothetical protein